MPLPTQTTLGFWKYRALSCAGIKGTVKSTWGMLTLSGTHHSTPKPRAGGRQPPTPVRAQAAGTVTAGLLPWSQPLLLGTGTHTAHHLYATFPNSSLQEPFLPPAPKSALSLCWHTASSPGSSQALLTAHASVYVSKSQYLCLSLHLQPAAAVSTLCLSGSISAELPSCLSLLSFQLSFPLKFKSD